MRTRLWRRVASVLGTAALSGTLALAAGAAFPRAALASDQS